MTTVRDNAILAARALLKQNPLFLDTETTGLTDRDEVVEIGILNVEGKTAFQTLVRPTVPVSDGARAAHHITDQELLNAPCFADISEGVKIILDSRTIVIYNAPFDVGKIRQSARATGCLEWFEQPQRTAQVVDAMILYARFYGDWDNYRKKYRWQKLENAAQQCGIKVRQNHRAIGDCELTRQIILYMAQQVIE